MFTAIPLPSFLWGGACMSLALPCLPLIGGLTGAVWWGAFELMIIGEVHIVLAVAILSAIPFLLTGFLHLDGYMDTCDAVLSRKPLEVKIQILKDPHVGSFAVISLAFLLLLQYAGMYVFFEKAEYPALLIAIAFFSRCCAAEAILTLNVMKDSSLAKVFSQNTGISHKLFTAVLAILAGALSFLYAGPVGLAVAGAVVLGYILATLYVYREFKGVSGDLTGFAIVVSELCGLITLAVI